MSKALGIILGILLAILIAPALGGGIAMLLNLLYPSMFAFLNDALGTSASAFTIGATFTWIGGIIGGAVTAARS